MQLKQLWELQERDLAITSLQKDIDEVPGLSGAEEKEEEVTQLTENISKLLALVSDDKKRLKQLELDMQKKTDDRKAVSSELYGGKVTSAKELEQMQNRMERLAEDNVKLEEIVLDLMETLEKSEAELKEKESLAKQMNTQLTDIKKKMKVDLEELSTKLADREIKRSELAATIEKKYLNKYELLRDKNQGRALALVQDDMCTGCRVYISAGLQGNLYNPHAMVYCENCGRLLYRP